MYCFELTWFLVLIRFPQKYDTLQRDHAALSKEEQILRGKLSRAEADLIRLNEIKSEMGEKVANLEKTKSDQSDNISRYVKNAGCTLQILALLVREKRKSILMILSKFVSCINIQ